MENQRETRSSVGGLIEEGEAFRRLGAAPRRQRHEVVVIGGGQAGLVTGYHLRQLGVDFVILDAGARVGDAWRQRWDSLRLFSPARYDGLDGMAFPGDPEAFPTKDEMADYLEAYAQRFSLPIRHHSRVQRLSRAGDRYLVETATATYEAEHVVVAMASYQRGRCPAFARELSPDIVQLHSCDYKGLAQLRPGGVLVVGAANSGAEIAIETVGSHPTWMSGRDPGEIPFDMTSFLVRLLVVRFLFRVIFHRLLTVNTPLGRMARKGVISRGGPRIRQKLKQLRRAGVQPVARTVGVKDGRPLLDGGGVLDVANVIWCTGYDHGLGWIDLPVFEPGGEPRHRSGLVEGEPGLYFVGQHFQHAFSSTMIQGVSRDAARMVGTIARRRRS
jgi:putative flavoprotein involved in K+ transport